MINFRSVLKERSLNQNDLRKDLGFDYQRFCNNFGTEIKPKEPKPFYKKGMLAYLIEKNGYNLEELAGIKEI